MSDTVWICARCDGTPESHAAGGENQACVFEPTLHVAVSGDVEQVREQIVEAVVCTPSAMGETRPVIDAVMAVVARVMAARDAAVERAAYWRQLAEKWADETTALEADLTAARHEREAAVWQATKSSEAASYHIEALTAARQQLDQVREGIAQAIEKHAEECGDPADNAYEYARIARQFDAPARPAGHGESGQITTTGLSAHPLRSAAGYPHVQGRCPACGLGSLFLASGGYLTCASLRCTDPTRASNLLHADAPVQSVASGSVEHSLERKPPDGGGGHTPGVGWMCTGCEWRFSYDVPEDRARAVWLADARHAQNAETRRGK